MDRSRQSQDISKHNAEVREQDAAHPASEAKKMHWPFNVGDSASMTKTITDEDIVT
jgi:hypothetical protein